jgi:myo-inositol-1(or 4)-monophosphatase
MEYRNRNGQGKDFNVVYFKVLKSIVLSGGLILKTFQGKVQNIPKKSDLPINRAGESSIAHTIIDDLSQEVALEILASHFPDVSIVVEEKTSRIRWFKNNISDLYFHLDPLDGTLAYIKNRNDYSIGAAFSKDQRFIACAIYLPALDQLYYTEEKLGYIHVQSSLGSKISFNRANEPQKLYCQKRCENFIPIMKQMDLKAFDCLSAHQKMIAVAEGKISIQMCHLANPHDFGIPKLIVEEVGGVCTDLEGNQIEFDPKFSRLPYFLAFYDESVKDIFFERLLRYSNNF